MILDYWLSWSLLYIVECCWSTSISLQDLYWKDCLSLALALKLGNVSIREDWVAVLWEDWVTGLQKISLSQEWIFMERRCCCYRNKEGPKPKAATELIKMSGIPEAIIRHMQKGDEELATEVAWVVVYITALSEVHSGLLIEAGLLPPLIGKLASSDRLSLLTPVLRSIGNLVAGDNQKTDAVLAAGKDIPGSVIGAIIKCLESQHRTLKKEAAWALSNIAAGTLAHKQLIFSSGAVSSLLHLLMTATFDIRKEVAYVLGNLCVATVEETGESMAILEHLNVLVNRRCLPGFINLIKSPDIEAAKLGLQFLELVMRSLPNGQGPKLVENEDGIAAMELFQFHENEEIRNMANGLVDKYFGESYGIQEEY